MPDRLCVELDRHWAEELWAERPPSDMWPTLTPAQLALLHAIKAALDSDALREEQRP